MPESALRAMPADNLQVWRYMPLHRLESLLDTSSLWFSRIQRFEDPYEGSVSVIATVLDITERGKRLGWSGRQAYHNWRGLHGALNGISRMCGFANCWCGFGHESAGLWRLYGGEIAIQSTIGRLKRCLEPHQSRDVRVGMVQYVEDVEGEATDDAHISKVILTKQLAYAHEHEVRAIFFQWPPDDLVGDPSRLDEYDIPDGIPLRVDVDRLIERVVVDAAQTEEFKARVETLLSQAAERYGFRPKAVDWSHLRRKPEFYRDPAEVIRRPVRGG